MSEHLAKSTKLYAQHLATIDKAAADQARQRKADEAHASLVTRQAPLTSPAITRTDER